MRFDCYLQFAMSAVLTAICDENEDLCVLIAICDENEALYVLNAICDENESFLRFECYVR